MISSLHSNKLTLLISIVFFTVVTFGFLCAEEEALNIWEKKEKKSEQKIKITSEENSTIKSPILSGDTKEIKIKIDEKIIKDENKSVIGIFDPEENNFNLNMWSRTDGEDIKKVLKRISKLKLSKVSEDLLFQTLFTNAYAPEKNLGSKEFLKIKIDWLIKKKRIKDLEILLKNNYEVGQNSSAIKFLINEYLSSADIKSACNKINFMDSKVKNNYLEKFKVYCLINDDRKDEAQLLFDLLKETGLNDNFFEDKINFLIGVTDKTSQKILDDNLLNFYLSHITSNDFKYEPKVNTDRYIWRYLSSANLIEVNNFEDETVIKKYEEAAAEDSFDNSEIFKIYLKINFNFNQILNAGEIYKNLPNYKSRALIYQSLLLSDDIERKINLAFLLKDLFIKDKLFKIYKDEFSNILKSIDPNEIPERYVELIDKNYKKNSNLKIKYDNEVLHRSKVIKHFLKSDANRNRTQKDLKSVYKKIKRNKKYFISIKDIIVLESLVADGIIIPKGLNYSELSSQLNVPKNLQDLVDQNQIGLLMLKIVEIIGEDKVRDLDPETVYFLNNILNGLNLKKIRNNILSESLPKRV